ncbi:uncharacterized protein [Parasteatoda tepidariorum]|uniref:uncharacterized protein isoform X2 n=1 Tax=Parasteatoda tepidariorum TaxID=114398 RepID=UPI00077F845A|nr:uncharacterized protein LOC107457478 isoform X2 [Parasteatoda tepidariorum]
MQVSPRTLLPLCIVLIFISHQCSSQFFTKIANSIPRMGKRYELPAVIRKVAKTLRFVIETVETYDKDGNGELNPEELMDVPVIQNAVRNFIENKDSRDIQKEEVNQSQQTRIKTYSSTKE